MDSEGMILMMDDSGQLVLKDTNDLSDQEKMSIIDCMVAGKMTVRFSTGYCRWKAIVGSCPE